MQTSIQNTLGIEAQPIGVIKITGLKNTNICNMENKGYFPKKAHLDSNTVRWVKAKVLQWIIEQLAARTEPPRTQG